MEIKGAPEEPVLDMGEIQGNVLAGFNKDHQLFLLLRITDIAAAKHWLMKLTAHIATLEEVLSFNRLFSSMRQKIGRDPRGLVATWLNVALTFDGLMKLTPTAGQFRDAAFRSGLAARSAFLGDPTDPTAEGNPKNWVIGGPGSNPDLLLILASDSHDELKLQADALRNEIGTAGVELLFEQRGQTRRDEPGHEHFGFKDGISQPGIRGRLSSADGDFLTPRWIDPSDPAALEFGTPGVPLIWPGEFVFGYPMQDDRFPLIPKQPSGEDWPPWAKNGSFLVFRRLQQRVGVFWRFVNDVVKGLSQNPDFAQITADQFASKLVGRWRSGAPAMRSPGSDNPPLASDPFAVNNFSFTSPATAIRLKPIPGYPGDHFPQSPGDAFGVLCPFAAHIRKVNPRDDGTDIGGASATLTRRLLRRGIPYGESFKFGSSSDPMPRDEDRGLLFLSYQTSISDQFEFLCNDWTNLPSNPSDGGHDPIIGQNGGAIRTRRFDLVSANGQRLTIDIEKEWVIPTGGGYFFAPSISALSGILTA